MNDALTFVSCINYDVKRKILFVCLFIHSFIYLFIYLFIVFFAISRATPSAYGGSQARGPIRAVATG